MRVTEALEALELQARADGRSEHTVRQYARHVRLLARWTDDMDVAELTPALVAAFMTSGVLGAKLSASANAVRSSLRVFGRFLEDAELAPKNPARMLRLARCSEPEPRALTDDEQARLLAVIDAGQGEAARRDSVLVRMLLLTGLRIGSALALDVRDVDLARGVIEVRTAKGARRYRVFLARELADILGDWLGDRTTGPLFPQLGARQAHRRIAGWGEAAGLRGVSAHTLRHTLAMRVYRRTGDLLLVQAALGHATVASSQRYARASEERVREAMGS